MTARDVRDATAAVTPAFEIVDSRRRGGARTLPTLVADSTNAARATVGPAVAPSVCVDPAKIAVTLTIGAGDRLVADLGELGRIALDVN
ncbi:hypothetical protein [Streptomyces rugosispiralis]|uniref:Uncharacterized protein n=1 Tax=Streptomyces rugosispiralis TaxID=2967341 RepID=A0ABT1USW6_9ACTN|nr:hypothetical protein [Streptomyces rugosispiralis]MCQ8188207.1 hypothetical protein [Streptomyces rugosispiralis]